LRGLSNLNQSLKAAKALLAHITKTVAEPDAPAKRNLLEDGPETDAALAETPIWLNIVSKRHIVSKPHLRPSKVYLPHPLNTKDTVTICL
jgi:ribosome biogenesis protein UTP30